MGKRALLSLFMLFLISAGFGFSNGQEEYPQRDISAICFGSAGGGTDVANRVIAAEMSKVLGVNVNVINKPGGVVGSVAISYGWNQPHDGYTTLAISEGMVTGPIQGGFDKKVDVWDFFIIGGSPDLISVPYDSPYGDLQDLIDAAKASPGKIKAGASAAGSMHHINLLAFEKGTGTKFNFVPYPGSAPSQTAALTGEVTVVVTTIAEQQQLLRSKKLKALAMLIPDSFQLAGIGTIPSAFDSYPELSKYLPIPQMVSMAVASDTPTDRKATLEEAFKKAIATDAVEKWADNNYYKLSGLTGKEAVKEFSRVESIFSWTLWELKAAKINPEEFGIRKP